MVSILICCVMGYLIGTINPAALIAKIKKHNLTESGTGNLGATNTMLAFGLRYGIFVLAFDLFKAFAAVLLAAGIFPNIPTAGLWAGYAAVCGHIYPFQLRFKGGKGSACFAGVVLASHPPLFLILLVICISLGLLIDYAFVVPVSAVLLFPIIAVYRTRSLAVFFITLSMGLLIIHQHKENFIAARNGTEGRFRTWFAEKIRSKL